MVITAISSQLYCFHIFTVIYSPLGKVIQTNIMISFQLANVSSVGRALHQYCRGQLGSNLVQAWISFRPHIHYCSSSVHNCKDSYITFIFTSLSTVHIYNFHTFTVVDSSLHGFIWNRHTDQLPVNWLISIVGKALHRHHRGRRFKSHTGLNFFQALSSVSLQQRSLPYSFLDNLLFIYMNFIYSQSFKTNFLSHGLIFDSAVRILKRN